MILAGDIGGTKTLLALCSRGAGEPLFERRFASAEYPQFDDLLDAFLAQARAAVPSLPGIAAAAVGVAGPVEAAGRSVHATNLPWTIDAAALQARFELGRVLLLNDFVAAAHGIAALPPGKLATLQAGEALDDAPRVLLGPGTGLGIAYLLPGGRVAASEGGHAGFAPGDVPQAGLWRRLYEESGRVEIEHVLSGPGLVRGYSFLAGQTANLTPEDIVARALGGSDPTAAAALDLFIDCLGAVAGDLALNVLARGGVYVAGGIAPHIVDRMRCGGFISSFNHKGAFTSQTRKIPVHVVLDERLGLLGAARAAFRLAQEENP